MRLITVESVQLKEQSCIFFIIISQILPVMLLGWPLCLLIAPAALQTFLFFHFCCCTSSQQQHHLLKRSSPLINPASLCCPRTWRKIKSTAKYRDILLYLPNSLLKCSSAPFLMLFSSRLSPYFTFPVLFLTSNALLMAQKLKFYSFSTAYNE